MMAAELINPSNIFGKHAKIRSIMTEETPKKTQLQQRKNENKKFSFHIAAAAVND